MTVLCKAFGLSYSSFKYRRRPARRIDPAQVELQAQVQVCHGLSRGSTGAKTLAEMVSLQGRTSSRYRAGRLMKQLGLHSTWQRKHLYRKSPHPHSAIKNTLNRQFDPKRPDPVWCSDVTNIWARRHGFYLSVMLDLYAHKPVGWARSRSADSKRTAKVLSRAYQS